MRWVILKIRKTDVILNDVKLKSVSLPFWILMFVPFMWLIILPANFLIDSLVLLISVKVLKLNDYKKVYKDNILKIFLLGMASKIIGILALFVMTYILSSGKTGAELYYTIPSLFISGTLIFVSNYLFTFNSIDKKLRFKLSLMLAILTAPYLLVLPISWH